MNKIIKSLLILIIFSTSLPSIIAKEKEGAGFTPGHEIRLGVGFFPGIPDYFIFHSRANQIRFPIFTNNNYNNFLHNNGARTVTGGISINYSYNILRWLSIGAGFTYTGDYQKKYDRITKEEIGRENTENFILTPMVRLSYLNTPMIRLYSQIGIGIALEYQNNKYYKQQDIEHNFYLSGHLTLVGISIGRKLFGFAELGYGSQGIATAGIGYKF